MSLIIEDKNALDSLANAIIRANGSVDKTSATKGELTDIINNIIPEKSKFASGVFTPSENITTQNPPRINFALGSDENGIPIKPNVIIAYQPYVLTENKPINGTMYSVYIYGIQLSVDQKYSVWLGQRFRITTTTSNYLSKTLQVGAKATDDVSDNFLFDRRGFLLKLYSDDYPFLAGHPIVWLQIKF